MNDTTLEKNVDEGQGVRATSAGQQDELDWPDCMYTVPWEDVEDEEPLLESPARLAKVLKRDFGIDIRYDDGWEGGLC